MAVVQITAEQVKQQLSALGYTSVPDFMIDAYLCKIASIEPCLVGAGYDDCDMVLIQVYAVTLMVLTAYTQRIKSQSAPSGASRSFDYGDNVLNLRDALLALDTSGCTSDLPIDVGQRVGLFMVVGGCG
ncbi:DUF7370 family protein [Salmonella enterica subsp. enterica serovar Altona]|uniref:DUF7370 family protein n=1 Tax=Salmonella enterica TaxID=28901 RepID=UPI000FAE38F8|nr:hypothetical protein [Salmonella enterica subsp. enterica serovar Emek]EAN0049954.1 hypothetical protein [Salmonella enterica]EBS4607671.1 hypothetical protein [Salmonella enterica subsp. enterica serovar Altona]MJA72403.1 hypothetical protein [Salmonella enterica subsp. enterica serovar Albany]ECA8324654.1 hypothetical protein [Salmonella enterica subsp. enterica serovar Emek]